MTRHGQVNEHLSPASMVGRSTGASRASQVPQINFGIRRVMEIALTAALLTILIGLNVKAAIAIWRDTFSECRQKIMQLALVWLLPLIGAIVVLAVHRPAEKPTRRYSESPDAGEDFSISGGSIKRAADAIDGD